MLIILKTIYVWNRIRYYQTHRMQVRFPILDFENPAMGHIEIMVTTG